jgi:hypothetical protein
MRQLAESRGMTATTLLTTDATSANVLAAIAEVGSALRPGDLFFLTYSGHGGQLGDQSGDEPDRLDETWALYDRQLLDDEIYALLSRFQPGVRVFMASDSCHSGSIGRRMNPAGDSPTQRVTRDQPLQSKAMPLSIADADARNRARVYSHVRASLSGQGAVADQLRASVLLISACQDDETAWSTADHGLYTEAFVAVVGGGPVTDYTALRDQLVERLTPSGQTPTWFVPGTEDHAFFAEAPLTV